MSFRFAFTVVFAIFTTVAFSANALKNRAAAPTKGQDEMRMLDPPMQPLPTIDEFQSNVMSTTVPVFLFVGSSKKTPVALRRNLSLAAAAVQDHFVSFYFDIETQAGKDFVQQAGLAQSHAQGNTDNIMLFNPEFVRQGDQGGFAKNPAVYTGKTTPYGIARWLIAMVSRKNLEYIQDLNDLAAWRKKFSSTSGGGTSVPKVLLLTAGNFTSPSFVSVSHQYRFLAQFGVVQGVTREAYDRAVAEMEKEEKEMKKIKDVGLDSAADKAAAATGAAAAAAAAAAGGGGAGKHRTSFSTFFDKADEILLASSFSPTMSGSYNKKAKNSNKELIERRDANHVQLLKVLGVRDVPAIVTLSGDLGDAEVYPTNNMSLARLQEIVREHALPADQLQSLFARSLQAEFELEQKRDKLSRQQKRESNKYRQLAEEDGDSSSASSSTASGGSGSGGSGGKKKKDENDLSELFPIWVNKTNDYAQHCEIKKKKVHANSLPAKTLCISVFMEDPLNNLYKYDEKVEELQKGLRKIEKQNRLNFEKVRLFVFEVPKHLDMAKFFSADSMFPAVVFTQPVKGNYHNHIGKFTGSSLAEFVVGRMKGIKAKSYQKEHFTRFFPEIAAEEEKRKKARQEWERKEQERKERVAERKRKKKEAEEAAAEAAAEAARKAEVDEEIVHEE